MSDFEINKGVGREVEFKGLRAQYLFIFAFGLLAVFVVFVIMYCNLQIFLCLFLEKLNMPQNTPVTKAS